MPTLEWIGKDKVVNHHQEVPYRVLERQYSYDEAGQHAEDNGSENMIIHGDNLEALKALLPRYEGKVKCIYIDPPYNTGNEKWVYNDNVNDPKIKKWLGEVVGKEGEDLSRHDKWLCMMYPRLKLLQRLLAEDGFIFVSIDVFEYANLKCIMDEIFGVANFRNCISVRRGIKNVQAQFETVQALSLGHEYIYLYSKNPQAKLPKLSKDFEIEKAGKWDTFWRGTDRPTMRYEIFGYCPEKGQWRFDQFEELFSQKGLYPLFDNVRVLCNEIDALQGPLVLGFAWKTDLTIPADHPAYYMWSNLADRRKEFELSQFKATEIKSAIKLFGRHLQEPVNPILNNYLTKQCQGYPWLLKKLCIHVFKLIHDGNSQDYVIGQRLNIVDLFERDISELTPDQHACVIEIAKSSPADYFSITETYGSDMVQTLINGRIVIRRASKLTLYWDIFRDYVLNKTVPELMLDYIPQQQFRTDMRAFACLIDKGDLASSELGKELSVSTATIDNIMIDAVMFGVAQRNSNTIHIIPDSKEALISTLQAIFKKHTVYVEIKKLGLEYFNYSHFAKIFHTIYTDNNINGKTKATYCSKLYNWFVCLGLFEEVQGQTHLISAPSAKSAAFNLDTKSRRGRYQSGGQNLFWGQTSPEKMICAYNLIDSGRTNYNELKSDGYRNAIEALVAARAIRKSGDEVHTICSLPQAFANIEQSDTIVFAKSLLENNPSMKSDEMGIKLEEKFTKKWKSGSRIRYGNAVIVWVKYLAANDHN